MWGWGRGGLLTVDFIKTEQEAENPSVQMAVSCLLVMAHVGCCDELCHKNDCDHGKLKCICEYLYYSQ